MRILVTGSNGFIGGRLCQVLTAQGHQVRAFHRSTSNLKLLDGLPVEHIIGDLAQPESIQSAMQDIEVVFHAAALLGGKGNNLEKMVTITVEGTRMVLQAALQAGVRRFVHSSSVAALGVPEKPTNRHIKPQPVDENHTWNYRPEWWPYGYTKYLAELEVQKAVAEGLDAVIVNPSLVFGSGDINRGESSIVVVIAKHRLNMLTEGGVNCVHIADVIDGHLAAMERGQRGERYILGGENLTLKGLLEMIATATSAPAPKLFIPASWVRIAAASIHSLRSIINFPVETELFRLAGNYFYYNTRKAQAELGLAAPRPVSEALQESYAWFKTMGVL